MKDDTPKTYLTDREAAQFLNLAVQTLRNWRTNCKGPPYIKLGRYVRYDRADLIAFMDKAKVILE